MTRLAKGLISWSRKNGRKNLPWQSLPPNPYHVWVSEIMLQQTQVSSVIPYFKIFIELFPSIENLSSANEDDVLSVWAGLGYYSRARNLLQSAKTIVSKHDGLVPDSYEDLIALPGIGQSTAGAILSLAFNQPHAILDGNVKRVLSRYHRVSGRQGDSQTQKKLWALAKKHTPAKHNANYTQAIMDLGATICKHSNPVCHECPIAKNCESNLFSQQKKFPTPRKTKARPEKKVAMLLYRNEKGDVFFVKKPPSGIWGGLWSLEECKDTKADIIKAINKHNIKAHVLRRLKPFKHSFTHYHLWIRPVIVSSPGKQRGYFNPSADKLALPSPVKKLISYLD